MIENKLRVGLVIGGTNTDDRNLTINEFKAGKLNIIITTNMLARGMDFPLVKIIINYDVPLIWNSIVKKLEPDFISYYHRVGRTGRLGAPGLALTICENEKDEMSM